LYSYRARTGASCGLSGKSLQWKLSYSGVL